MSGEPCYRGGDRPGQVEEESHWAQRILANVHQFVLRLTTRHAKDAPHDRLDYLSCVLTVLRTVLIGKKLWQAGSLPDLTAP